MHHVPRIRLRLEKHGDFFEISDVAIGSINRQASNILRVPENTDDKEQKDFLQEVSIYFPLPDAKRLSIKENFFSQPDELRNCQRRGVTTV